MRVSCDFCNPIYSSFFFFLISPEQRKGSDPALLEDCHHAWLSDLAALAWWITGTRQQSLGKDADCLFHSQTCDAPHEKKIGHLDTLL